MSPLDALIAEAELGEEARKFIASDLGRCLLGMSEQEVLAVHEELEKVDPTEIEKIRALQARIRHARNFGAWLSELVSRGEEALKVYQQQKES